MFVLPEGRVVEFIEWPQPGRVLYLHRTVQQQRDAIRNVEREKMNPEVTCCFCSTGPLCDISEFRKY